MSGHERERLSAYLDGELPERERAEVAAHLAACAACSAFLAGLRAADEAAAALPVEAPDGYFDDFARRVAQRLDAARTRRLPAWTWAAAAALLLAVVTPLTLRSAREIGRPAPSPMLAPATAPAVEGTPRGKDRPAAAPVAPAEATARRPRPALREAPPDERTTAAPAAVAPSLPTRDDAPATASAEAKAEAGFAPPPVAEAPAPLAAAPAQATAVRDTETDAVSTLAVREEPSTPATEGFSARRSAAAPAGVPGKGIAAGEQERVFRRLDAERPATAEEWRRLREGWAALAAAHAESFHADEARVRAIEAGREAWLAGGSDDDERAFRRDARAYLARADAWQRARVERLLREAPPAP
jgi:hypothetical protein